MKPGGKLSHSDWSRVVVVAGIGTVLEWFDFYIYAQLTSTLKKVFFPKSDPTAQTLLWWAIYAVGFVVRPLGALIFGHIGDTWGRNVTLKLSILIMGCCTVAIGILPTYDVGPYTAGLAAPILLTILRLLQGLAMGGEFAPAIIYISELAPVAWRGRLVAVLQMAVNLGMILATLLVMLLENTISAYDMQVWGWRIPFLLAFSTALLGYFMRRGMPEPKAFLAAARAEKEEEAASAAADGESPKVAGSEEGEAAGNGSVKSMPTIKDGASDTASVVSSDDMAEEAFDAPAEEGALTRFHGRHKSKYPVLRLLMNNWVGWCCQVAYMAWVSAAFYAAVTWLPAQLRDAGLKPILSQGMIIVSMLTNAAGLLACGAAFDKGVRAVAINLTVTTVGLCTGFGIYRGVWTSPEALDVNSLACWLLMPLVQLIIGVAMASVVLPATRIYGPLERTTGFSFGYNTGYGVIGGVTPFVVSSIIGDLSPSLKAYAPAIWLVSLGGVSLLGCAALRAYAPRLNRPFVGRIE